MEMGTGELGDEIARDEAGSPVPVAIGFGDDAGDVDAVVGACQFVQLVAEDDVLRILQRAVDEIETVSSAASSDDELSNGNAIVSTGNVNIEELNDPVINKLFAKSSTVTGTARTAIWSQVDEQLMKDAGILPLIYAKALLYRPPNLTNVYVQSYYGMYNYAVLGVKS